MKMKINKACDLSSISVLPPHSRRLSGVLPGPQSSQQLLRSQASQQQQQLRSQASQQTLSQGISSQHGMFSQMSQNSLDEVLTSDQRLGSQEREISTKKISSLVPLSYTREESQMPISRSSTSLMNKWNSASVSGPKCRISEELEHRIGMVETSVNRFGMILDSVQSDVMQVNKGTKELSLELDFIRQKLTGNDNLLQLMSKGQEDVRQSLGGGLKSLTDQLSRNTYQDKLQETLSTLSVLPEQIETFLLKIKDELCTAFTKELKDFVAVRLVQEKSCSLIAPNQSYMEPKALPPKGVCQMTASQRLPQPIKIFDTNQKKNFRANSVPKIEMGSWNSVKMEKATLKERYSRMEFKQREAPLSQKENVWTVNIESDEEINGEFSSLYEENGKGNYLEEADEETKRILRKARRRKRKYSNAIVID